MTRILILENQASVQLALRHILSRAGYEAHFSATEPQFMEARQQGNWSAFAVDPGLLSTASIELLRSSDSRTVFLIGDDEAAVTAGDSVLRKSNELASILELLDPKNFQNSPDLAVEAAKSPSTQARIHGDSSWRAVEESLAVLSQHDFPVLIQGESGTGKELVARALHEEGPRAAAPFEAIHCGAIPHELLESELFGHEKGSFTDAHRRKLGRFEVAGSGTLFLDEIGEMPTSLQAKLLRCLQERSFRRLGGNSEIALKARIVAATHRELTAAVDDGEFREDLLHRLLVGNIKLPPLRERPEDIDLLSSEFLRRDNEALGCDVLGLSAAARHCLHVAPWPGNVRELEHTLRRAVAMAREGILEPTDLGLTPVGADATQLPGAIRAAWEARIRNGDTPGTALEAIRGELAALEKEWRKSEAKK